MCHTAALLCLLSHDQGFLLRLWLCFSNSRMLPPPLLLDSPGLQYRSLELVRLVNRFWEVATPMHHGWYKMVA